VQLAVLQERLLEEPDVALVLVQKLALVDAADLKIAFTIRVRVQPGCKFV
jgi:hypothetical protein